jgi:hypothetical protein
LNRPKSETTTGKAKKATRKGGVVRMKSREARWRAINVEEGWRREGHGLLFMP